MPAIYLNKSLVFFEYFYGDDFVKLGDKLVDLQEFCDEIYDALKHRFYHSPGEEFVDRIKKFEIKDGRKKYTLRIAVSESMKGLDDLWPELSKKEKFYSVGMFGFQIEMGDLVLMAEYLLTCMDLIGKDPRMDLWEKLKKLNPQSGSP